MTMMDQQMAPAPQATGVPQAEANYREAEAPGQQCSTCQNFKGPTSCQLVEGVVQPEGVCDLFSPGGEAAMPALEDALLAGIPMGGEV